MHTKKYIDNLLKKAICEVSLVQLTEEDIQNYKLSLIKNKDNTPKADSNTLKEDGSTYTGVKTSKDAKITEADKTYIDNNSSIGNAPANKKQKLDINGIDGLKISRENETHKFKSQFKSSLSSNNEIASTSIEEVHMGMYCKETTESAKSSAKNVKSWIRVTDLANMMDEDVYKIWMKNNGFDIEPKLSTTGPKLSLHSNKVKEVEHPLNGENHVRGNLIEIEKLYIKYFSKAVQDTVVTIANILNIISISSKYHEHRMNEFHKKIFEAENLKESCDADKLHKRHKKILETKLKNNFIGVISSFAELEFYSVFQMFFLCILTVLRVLDQPKFSKGGIFKNLVHLLWSSLKNSEINHQLKKKIFSILRSKSFRPDCIELISIIEDSRNIDPGVTDRMTLFFVSTVNSREYFQAVIDAVTNGSNKDLELLIDNAIFRCCINSKFKDPVDSSTVLHQNNKIPVQETIQRPINSDITVQNLFPANNPDGTYQQIPVLMGNTAVKPLIVTSQPNFCEPFSYSLQNTTSESSISKVIQTKKCTVTPTISNSSLMQVSSSSSETPTTTKFVTFNPSIQNKKTVANNQRRIAIGSIIKIGDKRYRLINGPLGRMRAVDNGTKILVKSPSTVIKCYFKNCNSSVTIMCSGCKTVKYCSYDCQRHDWYDNHKDVCK